MSLDSIISPRVRTGIHVGNIVHFDGFGIVSVLWFCVFVNLLMLLGLLLRFTPRVERESIVIGEPAQKGGGRNGMRHRFASNRLRWMKIWFKESPISNGKFMFFIFVLMPVQTLFANEWLVTPEYVTLAFSKIIADNMECIVNIANPLIIVLGVPVITALTRKVPVYRMMIIGSLVSALPTFLFVLGLSFPLLMSYIILFSLGEAL